MSFTNQSEQDDQALLLKRFVVLFFFLFKQHPRHFHLVQHDHRPVDALQHLRVPGWLGRHSTGTLQSPYTALCPLPDLQHHTPFLAYGIKVQTFIKLLLSAFMHPMLIIPNAILVFLL